ncbi:MAG: hypothetical protein MZV49_20255 [Rhodopseudomonas palustris]|nr:hypothetical protein [Rhodopseudomonas palustris]
MADTVARGRNRDRSADVTGVERSSAALSGQPTRLRSPHGNAARNAAPLELFSDQMREDNGGGDRAQRRPVLN